MKIKNLETYIEKRIKTSTDISKLGTKEEPLFSSFEGTSKELNSFLRGFCSFAALPCEQLFYEYIQNAYDSAADRIMFFINERYMLIVNNGNPFYTGYDFENKKIKGQFHKFLALHSSNHPDDKNVANRDLGKYGQGSKLIYTLLADNDLEVNSEDALYNAVKKGKSPYIISWSSPSQINCLLQGFNSDYKLTDPEDSDSILFTKIMMGYYPLHPGCDLFKHEEALNVLSEIKKMIPQDQLLYLDKGSAFLIPLGKGIYDKLTEKNNIKKVTDNASVFLSIYKKYESKEHKLKDIFINDNKVGDILDCVTIPLTIEWANENNEVAISFSKEYKNGVNLFKALPIINSKHNLGFVVNAPCFETDNARQNLTDREKPKNIIGLIFEKAINEIPNLGSEDRKKIAKALLHSNISLCNDDHDNYYITEPFNEYFLPLLKESIPTTDEGFETLEKIWYSDTALPVSPQTLGIDKKLVSKEVVDLLEYNHDIQTTKADINTLLDRANESCLKKYILSLNEEEYNEFMSLIPENSKDWKIYRTNKRNVYSFKEVLDNAILFYTDDTMRHLVEKSGLEYIEYKISDKKINKLFDIIERNIQQFQTVNASDLACYILSKSPDIAKVQKIALLKSKSGQYLSFDNLFIGENNKKSINSGYFVDGIVSRYAQSKWFCQDWKAWVRNNADKVKDILDWDKCHSIYVEEIIDAYKDCSINNDSYFPLYLDDNNLPTTEQKSLHNADHLSDEEYKTVTSLFNDTSFLNIAYRKILSKKPFKASLNNISIDDLIEEDVEYDLYLVSIFFKLDQHLLKKFSISKTNENFTFQSEDSKINILDAEGLTNEQKKLFIEVGGVFIPKEIETLISSDEKERCSPFIWEMNTLLYRAVTQTQDPKELFSLIIKSKKYEAIETFLKRIEINIEDKITNHDIRWKIIMYSIENQNFIQLTRDCITVNGESLPQNITERYITCNGTRYDIYELLDAVRSDNAIISNLEDYLSSPMMDIFKNAYYKNKIALESKCIFNKLIKDKLTLKQFVFCMDYAKETEINEVEFKLDKEDQIPEALQLISKKEYKGFEKLLYIPEYSDIQVYAKEEIILKEERLPQVLIAWIKGDEKNLSLFNSIWKESDSLIQLRRDILEDKKWTNPTIKDKGLIERTTKWLLLYNKDISFKSNSFDAINCYADNLKNKDADKDIVLLQLLPKVDNNQKLLCKIVKMSETNENDTYYIYENEAMQIQDLMKKGQKEKIIPFLNDNKVLIIPSKEFAGKYSITKDKTINISQQPDIQDAQVKFEEWSKKSGITIYMTTQNVSTSVFFKVGDNEICQIPCKNSTDGYVEDKYIVIKDPRPEKKIITVLKELCNRSEYRWFHKHCIDLLSMILDGIISEKDHITTNSSDNPANGGQNTNSSVSNNGTNGKGTGSGNISVKEENKDLLKYLDSWDKDLLTWIKENPKKIKQLQETGESQIKKICGYLGEQLYLGYMNKKNIKIDDVTDKNFADFKIENGEYVDVKTNIGTMKSEPKPIHIHKETQKYLNETSNNKLLIFHISLQDVGMETDYRRLEAKYGKDADPRKDVNLKEECDKLANEYWKNKTLEDFKKETSEYILSTPIKKS